MRERVSASAACACDLLFRGSHERCERLPPVLSLPSPSVRLVMSSLVPASVIDVFRAMPAFARARAQLLMVCGETRGRA